MTCTKTGCHVWLEPYNEWLYGDAFEVSCFRTSEENLTTLLNVRINQAIKQLPGDQPDTLVSNIAYFKITARSFKPINNFNVKHYTIHDFAEWIKNDGKDSVEREYWPPSILITNNFTNHGYNGVKF